MPPQDPFPPELRALMYEMAKINDEHQLPPENFIMEEAGEFIMANMKLARSKDDQSHIDEEAMDMFCVTCMYFLRRGITAETLHAHMMRKFTNAVNKYHDHGEV